VTLRKKGICLGFAHILTAKYSNSISPFDLNAHFFLLLVKVHNPNLICGFKKLEKRKKSEGNIKPNK